MQVRHLITLETSSTMRGQYYTVRLRTTKYYTVLYAVLLRTTKYYTVVTPYYTVLHNTTPYYTVLLRTTKYYKVLHSTTPFYKVLHSTTPFYKKYYTGLLRTTKYYTVLLRTTKYYTVLLRTTKYYTVLLRTTKYYTVLHRTSQHYSVLHNTTPYYKVLHGITPYYTVLLSITRYYSVRQSTTKHYTVQRAERPWSCKTQCNCDIHDSICWALKLPVQWAEQFLELKIYVSLQVRAIEPPNHAKGFIQQNQNARLATAACIQKFRNERFATAACAKMYEISISLQFRTIDPPNPARSFIQQNQNARLAIAARGIQNDHVTTVLNVWPARSDERVAKARKKFAFCHSLGRPTSMKKG